MITANDIIKIGTFNKPHGLKGEIAASILPDIDCDCLECVFVDIDGIFVPFFITEWRTKSSETVLLTIEDVGSAESALLFSGKDIYIQRSDLNKCHISDDCNPESEFITYDSLVGYIVMGTDGTYVGKISRVDDSTENVLIVLTASDGGEILLPLAEDWIVSVEPEKQEIVMDIPVGLLYLNA